MWILNGNLTSTHNNTIPFSIHQFPSVAAVMILPAVSSKQASFIHQLCSLESISEPKVTGHWKCHSNGPGLIDLQSFTQTITIMKWTTKMPKYIENHPLVHFPLPTIVAKGHKRTLATTMCVLRGVLVNQVWMHCNKNLWMWAPNSCLWVVRQLCLAAGESKHNNAAAP